MNYFNPYQQMYTPPVQDPAQYRQPYQMQSQLVQQSAMVWVRNRMEAEAYPVAPNTAIALWDLSGPYVHRKETDVSGRPVIKTYKLVEATEAAQQASFAATDYITRQEFQAFAESLKAQTTQKEAVPNE